MTDNSNTELKWYQKEWDKPLGFKAFPRFVNDYPTMEAIISDIEGLRWTNISMPNILEARTPEGTTVILALDERETGIQEWNFNENFHILKGFVRVEYYTHQSVSREAPECEMANCFTIKRTGLQASGFEPLGLSKLTTSLVKVHNADENPAFRVSKNAICELTFSEGAVVLVHGNATSSFDLTSSVAHAPFDLAKMTMANVQQLTTLNKYRAYMGTHCEGSIQLSSLPSYPTTFVDPKTMDWEYILNAPGLAGNNELMSRV